MAEKIIWQIFCTKIHDFLVAEPLNEMFKFLNMLYYLHSSIVKNLLPVLKNQNGIGIQDGVKNVYIFNAIFFFSFFIF
jgi:hypothetical protein